MLIDKSVGIVTIYNNDNCGSFLQALALNQVLEEKGYKVYFVSNKRYLYDGPIHKSIRITKKLVTFRFRQAYSLLSNYIVFGKLRKRFKMCSHNAVKVAVYGSDTIWNMQGSFGKEWKHYWGYNYAGKKIAYSPSISPLKPNDILTNESLCLCLKNFDYISVRDSETEELIKQVKKEDSVTKTIDPTMLLPVSFYRQFVVNEPKEKYILFYCFATIDDSVLKAIRNYAHSHGLKIYSFNNSVAKVDKLLKFNPIDMMTYYNSAEFVVTDTFHGNVFSIIYNKNFINIDTGKKKVIDLLNTFGLDFRTAKSAEDVEKIIDCDIDYKSTNSILEELRNKSKNYLYNAVENCFKDIDNGEQIKG